MVVTPEDFRKARKDQTEQMLEDDIDQSLLRGHVSYIVNAHAYMEALDSVVEKYRTAGWKVEVDKSPETLNRFKGPRLIFDYN